MSDRCPNHPTKEADFYCYQCNQLICSCCLVPSHRDHEYDLWEFAKLQKVLADSSKPMEEQIAALEKAVESVDTRCSAVVEQKTAVVAEIRAAMAHLRQALEERETKLVDEVEWVADQKLEALTAQHSVFELQLGQLRSSQEFVDVCQRTCSQGEMMSMKDQLVKQMTDLTGSFKPESLLPAEQANMGFAHSLPEPMKSCQQFGKVYCNPACPEKCHVSGEGIKLAMRGQTVTVTVEALNREGKPCFAHEDSFRCELVPSDGSSPVRGTVKKREQNIYNISYQPQVTGEHALNIAVEDHPISNSPFPVTVLPNFTATAKMMHGFNGPYGVAIREGDMVVAECSGRCVSIVNERGDKKSFGTGGSRPGRFNNPKGVAIDNRGKILVTDCRGHCIHWLSSTGMQLLTVGEEDSGPPQFKYPVGIKVHPLTQKVYVVEFGNSRIQVLNSDLTHSLYFGREGSGIGEFKHPYDLSTDSKGNVYVADGDNHRIQVFTADGVYLRHFGGRGEGEGELNRPNTIAVDENRNLVYVGEWGNGRISIFSTDGEFIKSFGERGNGDVQFGGLFLLAVDGKGTVYVSDANNGRIQIFN